MYEISRGFQSQIDLFTPGESIWSEVLCLISIRPQSSGQPVFTLFNPVHDHYLIAVQYNEKVGKIRFVRRESKLERLKRALLASPHLLAFS
jgi:hypothetical protein